MFEYDITLSFAGEQRAEVEQIADCLIAAGAKVFYDKYSKAELWGKDLYQHLSAVYQKKARYCMVFISKEYAEKAWTSHELKAAQARAFAEKGAEYILPVRFDDTEVAGVLPTTGFLDFRSEGAAGICAAALEKLGKATVPHRIPSPTAAAQGPFSCDSSPRALILSKELNVTIFPLVAESTWSDQIELSIEPEDKETDAVLTKMRGQKRGMLVAYGLDVAEVELESAVRSTVRGEALWKLQFRAKRSDFRNDMEMGTSGTTAEQFAEMRVRRLLLNEFLPQRNDQGGNHIGFLNNLMQENLIQGTNPIMAVEKSLFPDLFRQLGSSPQPFLESAWISAVVGLKLSSAIEHIDYLKLALSGELLHVKFRGYRHRRYSNVEPYKIEVSGQLRLAE
ncbi:toll/interleukin-1 receptor domain-containing protein [Acidicapsa acidisoli]|uniref:toll/interleukin-1 receptor domain-containing protein n=1 Tax=Acidicapsa acidisoli TaxID=1615681 RepID=UPI0021DFCA62|nr:TIR domain-containing protein [Acidicapsa acidisoli]